MRLSPSYVNLRPVHMSVRPSVPCLCRLLNAPRHQCADVLFKVNGTEHVSSLSLLNSGNKMLYGVPVSEAGGGIPCRPNPTAILLVKIYKNTVLAVVTAHFTTRSCSRR